MNRHTASYHLRVGYAILALSTFLMSWSAAEETRDHLFIGGGTLDVNFDGEPSPAVRNMALEWITRAAKAVTVYYGHYPVRHVVIDIHLRPGVGVGDGHAYGDPTPRIAVSMGIATRPKDINDQANGWMMTHEMVHLALSSLEENHHWLEEGLATYVEPIGRVRAGELSSRQVWRDMIKSMPQGQPAARDRGLDSTPTWGRTYWGGAMFCLLADVEIHRQTRNHEGLETALRGIVESGGTIDTEWGLRRTLAAGDKALGKDILESLYDKMKDQATPVDLDGLWRNLGVEVRDGRIVYNDDAPMAGVRKSMMPDDPLTP